MDSPTAGVALEESLQTAGNEYPPVPVSKTGKGLSVLRGFESPPLRLTTGNLLICGQFPL
jgi:hypothetical protein